jgi:hypothetical protein
MLNTRTGENYNDNDVINSNDLRKRLLNVDSRFRSNLGDMTTNFQHKLGHPYKNVIRMKLSSIEIPNTIYTFTLKKNNISFRVKTLDISGLTRTLLVTIPEGNYSASSLLTEIQNQFNTGFRNPFGIFLSLTLDVATAKVSITHNGLAAYPVTSPTAVPTASAEPLTLYFDSPTSDGERNNGIGLGYNLGFRQKTYNVTTPFTTSPLTTYKLISEACINTVGDNYIFLTINDLHVVDHKTNSNYLQVLAKIIIREERNAIIFDDGSSCLSNEIIFPAPTELSQFNIKLVDPYGACVDLNGMNFSFTLEITEVLNTKLYDFYRNYIWSGVLPSVNYKKVEGSAVGLLRGRI